MRQTVKRVCAGCPEKGLNYYPMMRGAVELVAESRHAWTLRKQVAVRNPLLASVQVFRIVKSGLLFYTVSCMKLSQLVITSPDNRTFKALCKLTDGRGLKKQGRTIVSGPKLVRELALDRPGDCCSLIVFDSFQDSGFDSLMEQFSSAGKLIVLKKSLFNELDIFGTNGPLLEMTAPAISEWDCRLTERGCVLAVPFQDPANVGSAVRSAAAFGVRQVVLLKEAANPFHPKSIRASGGAVFRLSFSRGPSLAEVVQQPDAASRIVALDMQGASILTFSFPEAFLLLPGMEGQGLPEDLRRHAVAIPMTGAVESLNAATAVSIALFCWRAGQGASFRE
jgi:RNA methyltransferase, TrmH family